MMPTSYIHTVRHYRSKDVIPIKYKMKKAKFNHILKVLFLVIFFTSIGSVLIIVFQSFKNITRNEEVRKKELVKEYEYFNSHNKSVKVVLLPIGDLFDLQMKYDGRVELLYSTNHPTTYGSKLLAEMLGKLVMEFMNK